MQCGREGGPDTALTLVKHHISPVALFKEEDWEFLRIVCFSIHHMLPSLIIIFFFKALDQASDFDEKMRMLL